MSKSTIALIKSALLTAAGMASIYIHGSLVTDFVISEIDRYFE